MASLPPRPSQRSSPVRHESLTQSQSQSHQDQPSETGDSISQSTATLDSQTVFVSSPGRTDSSPRHESGGSAEDEEPRKCWICFSDETEDTAATSTWRSPCPCALTAHEACLLDWVADLEAPQNRNRPPKKIQCPQCKTEVKIARPRSSIVSSVAAIDRMAGRLTIPGIAVALGGCIWSGAWVHGMVSTYIIFGANDFNRLSRTGLDGKVDPKFALGAPLIPLVLMATRTSLADGILPVLPVLFFATHLPESGSRVASLWPPSAAMTFAILPYIRAIYNETYRQLFAEKEKQWARELRPRQFEDNADNGGHGQGDDDNIIGGIQLDLEIVREDAGPDRAPGDEHQEDVNGLPEEAVLEVPGPDAPAQRGGANNFVINTSRVADAVMGALCFPAIAAVAGELLRASLPKALTTSSLGRRPGLLQSRWGRSVLGGCLFVVMKDTLVLYSRYKLARGQRERKVVDWEQRPDKRDRT